MHEGELKRLGGTPLPKASYSLGKIGAGVVITIAQVVAMLAIGVAAFNVDLPDSAALWWRLIWLVLLGIAAGWTLGIAYTRLVPSASAAPAIVQPPFLVLQFISGVFFVFSDLPEAMRVVATVFPLKWMAQGLRSVFLPDDFQFVELSGSWELEGVVLVLGLWFLAGLLIAPPRLPLDTRGALGKVDDERPLSSRAA